MDSIKEWDAESSVNVEFSYVYRSAKEFKDFIFSLTPESTEIYSVCAGKEAFVYLQLTGYYDKNTKVLNLDKTRVTKYDDLPDNEVRIFYAQKDNGLNIGDYTTIHINNLRKVFS